MSEYMFDNFISEMVVHLRAIHPEKTKEKNNESMRKFVRDSVDKANSFNIRTVENLEFFLECTIEYGFDFYSKPDYAWAKKILEDDSIDETEKMNRINEQQIFGGGSNVG